VGKIDTAYPLLEYKMQLSDVIKYIDHEISYLEKSHEKMLGSLAADPVRCARNYAAMVGFYTNIGKRQMFNAAKWVINEELNGKDPTATVRIYTNIF
jgi:hypothetical protein